VDLVAYPVRMGARIATAVLVGGGLFPLLGLFVAGDPGAAGFAAAGAVFGVGLGLYWHVADKRAHSYRLWGVVLAPLMGLSWVVPRTFTEIGPEGIRLRGPFTTRMVAWSELAGVGWRRTDSTDVVVLSTQDGELVETVGLVVSATGAGRDRALRMLADIERHWAWRPTS
jgi:hypothetical protein